MNTKHIQVTTSGAFRVRFYRDGITHGTQHETLEAAIKERDALVKALKKETKVTSLQWHKAQKATLPPFTSLKCIYRTSYGYMVKLNRAIGAIYCGHFKGESALLDAVAQRDKKELEFPLTR